MIVCTRNVPDISVPQLGAIDWIALAMLTGSLLLGAWRGFMFEVLSLLSWIAAFIVAQVFAEPVAAALPMGESNDSVRYAAGFALVFVAIIFVCNLVAALVRRLVNAAGLRPIDRVLGAMFGVLRAGVLVLVVGLMMQLTPLGSSAWWKDSVSGPVITSAVQALRPLLPERIASLLDAECCALSTQGKRESMLPGGAGFLGNWGN